MRAASACIPIAYPDTVEYPNGGPAAHHPCHQAHACRAASDARLAAAARAVPGALPRPLRRHLHAPPDPTRDGGRALATRTRCKQVFTGDPRLLHAGEANVVLLPLLGRHSVLLLDEGAHMAQRKLLLPAVPRRAHARATTS